MLKPGDIAPDFALPTHTGGRFSLAENRGARVLLWFYIQANTPACTLEGLGFRDHREYFDQNNIRVVGISFDPPDDNAAFAARHQFEFPLLSDRDHSVAVAYGACPDAAARNPERMSFLIDEQGRIERVYPQVDPRDHPARVLADVLGI